MAYVRDRDDEISARRVELELKLEKVRRLIRDNRFAAALFASEPGFAWIGCGATDPVDHSNEMGRSFGSVLVTPDRAYLLASTIELPRIVREETVGLPFEPVEYPWTDGSADASLRKLVRGPLAADVRIEGAVFEADRLALLRTPLGDNEIARFRALAASSAEAVEHTMHRIEPGMSEIQIQALAGEAVLARGAYPSLILVGADERIASYRHPVPTDTRMRRYCMVVVCAQQWGLVASVTRLAHFGSLPGELLARYEALRRVELAIIEATRPGASLAEIFAIAARAYAQAGYPREELLHFQGGTCGYLSRERELAPGVEYRIQNGEVFAHNPSITGVKIEDTILVGDDRYEVLTASGSWPQSDVAGGAIRLKRPDILVR